MKGFLKASAVLLTTVGLALAAPSASEAAPGGSGAGQVAGPLQNIIRNKDVMVEEEGRFIEPCIDVLRGLRFASAATGVVFAEVDFTYLSYGLPVSAHRSIPLSQFYLHPHESNSNPFLFEQVAAEIDLGDALFDNDQDVTTSVSLVVQKGSKRTVLATSVATSHVDEGGFIRGEEEEPQTPQ